MSDQKRAAEAEESDSGKSPKKREKDFKKTMRWWFSVLPGTWRDYFMITLVALDVLILLMRNSYGDVFLDRRVSTVILIFDICVISLWFIYFIVRFGRESNRIVFLKNHWYEILGMIPLTIFRPFLLLRAAKFAIAFYKLGRSERDVSTMITRDITFRFRDIIVDAIADAVFLQSLNRVEEVMVRLDYARMAHRAFDSRQQELNEVVNEALKTKSIVGEISKLPLMGNLADRMGKEVSLIIKEIFETEAIGNIMKDITKSILQEMHQRVRLMDLERITGRKINLHDELEESKGVVNKKDASGATGKAAADDGVVDIYKTVKMKMDKSNK